MGPIAKEVAASYAGKSVKFVTFDFTSDETKAAAEATAKELGVEAVYAEKAPKTGFALVYDTAAKKVIARLSAKETVEQWSTTLAKGLGEG